MWRWSGHPARRRLNMDGIRCAEPAGGPVRVYGWYAEPRRSTPMPVLQTALRGFAVVAAVGAGAFLATPGYAHGAPDSPVSRAVACGPEAQKYGQSPACRAAAAVAGTQQFAAWDNLRVPNVNGRDRQVIPDGKLCSGGLPLYRGLDLAR